MCSDSGHEPSWYVSDLYNLVADYCLTWREPLLTYQLYGVVAAVVGMPTSLWYNLWLLCRIKVTYGAPV